MFNRRPRTSGPNLLRHLDRQRFSELLLKVGRIGLKDTMVSSRNRDARRAFSRMQRHHGRGYTTPLHGRAHTRGSGRGRR